MRPDPDRAVQVAKRLRRRFYLADYEDENSRLRWSRPPADAPWSERVYGVRPDPATVRSVLVFKPDEMGDAVYALPAVAELRRTFPQARLFLICQRLTEPLYRRTGLFDEIVAVELGSRLTRPTFSVGDALARFSVPSFDVSVYLRTYPAFFREFLEVPSSIKVHPVDPSMRSDSVHRAHISLWDEQRLHQSLQLLQIVGRLSGKEYSFADVEFPRLTWTHEDRQAPELVFGGEPPARFVVVHPFAKHETRQYPLDYWTRLIADMRERVDAEWVIVGGPEDPRLDGLPGVVQAQGTLTLAQTAYLTTRAGAFMGVLSGPAHWAAALGAPALTIMSGHSLPVEWAPLGDSHVVRADVPCAPCHQHTCPVYGLACLTELRPERIGSEVEEFLTSRLRAVTTN